jgi:hypothetical protein
MILAVPFLGSHPVGRARLCITTVHPDHPLVSGSTDRDNGRAEMPWPKVSLSHRKYPRQHP